MKILVLSILLTIVVFLIGAIIGNVVVEKAKKILLEK